MTDPLSVVQVVLKFDKGGLEMTALNLCRELRRRGHRASVLAIDGGGETCSLARSEGFECVTLEGRRLWSPSFHAKVALALRRLRSDVVHTHHFAALLHSLAVRPFAPAARRVHTEHSEPYLAGRADMGRWLRRMSGAVDDFVLVADSMVPTYRDDVGVDGGRLRVIPNGIDTARFTPAVGPERAELRRELGLNDGIWVGSAGRLVDVKDYPLLLRAVATLRRSHPRLGVVLAGDGPDRPALEQLGQQLGLGARVRFLGWQRDTAPILRALDAFVLSSKSEALPLALLEAMACGLPIVATRVGDVGPIVEAAGAGVVVPAGAEAQFVAALEIVLGGTRADFGFKARSAIERQFSITAMTDRYLQAYVGGGGSA